MGAGAKKGRENRLEGNLSGWSIYGSKGAKLGKPGGERSVCRYKGTSKLENISASLRKIDSWTRVLGGARNLTDQSGGTGGIQD